MKFIQVVGNYFKGNISKWSLRTLARSRLWVLSKKF